MANGFHHLSIRADDLSDDSIAPPRFRSSSGSMVAQSNEAAARGFLDRALRREMHQPTFRGIVADDVPARVPALAAVEVLRSPFGDNTVVRFRQLHNRIPVYGARATVELKADQGLSQLDVDLADGEELDSVGPIATSSPEQALDALRDALGATDPRLELGAPELVYFRDEEADRFLLCWLVRDVPAAPPGRGPSLVGGWEAASRRLPVFNYFIDATKLRIVAALSVSRSLEAPVACKGMAEDGTVVTFDGRVDAGGYAMADPIRHVTTYDLALEVYSWPEAPLGRPVVNPTTDWGETNRAAVTAHHHAIVVHDFIESVLHRQGVDGNQMSLDSVVNCTDQVGNDEWSNAQWTGSRMIYGQARVNGQLVSFARHLDVIAHELMHGITQHTADLTYRFESGALNESMSDIFGIIVLNRAAGRTDVTDWTWELGHGLGDNAGPLRDLRDPSLGSPPQPAHMRDWLVKEEWEDNGGVHFNSGIHNRAAYELLNNGAFTPEEVAALYYYVLLQLTNNAGFSDVRRKLLEVVRTRWPGADGAGRSAAVEAAYASVGVQ